MTQTIAWNGWPRRINVVMDLFVLVGQVVRCHRLLGLHGSCIIEWMQVTFRFVIPVIIQAVVILTTYISELDPTICRSVLLVVEIRRLNYQNDK